jgi:hypothetical protein
MSILNDQKTKWPADVGFTTVSTQYGQTNRLCHGNQYVRQKINQIHRLCFRTHYVQQVLLRYIYYVTKPITYSKCGSNPYIMLLNPLCTASVDQIYLLRHKAHYVQQMNKSIDSVSEHLDMETKLSSTLISTWEQSE